MGGALAFGVVGVGKIGSQYFDSFARFPGIRLGAVVQRDGAPSAQVPAIAAPNSW